jgi:hypothetical protein
MTAIPVPGVREVYLPRIPWLHAWILALLVFIGVFSLVALRSDRAEQPQCGGFTIGVSAIGGCDRIGG